MKSERSIGRTVVATTLRLGEEVGFVGGAAVSFETALKGDLIIAGVSAGVSVASKAVPMTIRMVREVRNQRRMRNQNNSAR